jgi:hypothetical protein
MSHPFVWNPMCLLPNVNSIDPIGCDVAVLVGATDSRVMALAERLPALNAMLTSFTDQSGQAVRPSLILLKRNAPTGLQTAEAIAALRNAICMSVISLARARHFQATWTDEPKFSDVFDIYPWMLSALGTELTAWTPAIVGTRDVLSFRGQTSPSVSPATITLDSVDEHVLVALLRYWRQRFESSTPNWADIALFRSLSMAFHASRIPAGPESTHFDSGRLVALWVSALEILFHPGKKVGQKIVKEHVGEISWLVKPSETSKEQPSVGDTAICIVKRLYQCRNDYLHGNPVKIEGLKIGSSQRYVSDFAAPLYRMALAKRLDLPLKAPVLGLSDEDLATYIVKHRSFEDRQMTFEKCILAAA